MNVCAIIVTYGNRFSLIEKVANACIENGVQTIFVVDNGSPEKNRLKLYDFALNNNDYIQLIRNDHNLGSAGGYSIGLQRAKACTEFNHFLLLDDDNLMDKNSYLSLLQYWKEELSPEERMNSALLALREDREYYVRFTKEQNDDVLLGTSNSFMHYDFFSRQRIQNVTIIESTRIKTPIAPYGGLLIPRCLLDKIGLPLEDMFLYIDDIEFSYRITSGGGNIFIVPDSKILDIDQSWGSKAENHKKKLSSPVLEEGESFRIYYTFRNRSFFEYFYRVNNKPLYFFNMFVLLLKLSIKAIALKKTDRLSLILLAVYDGIRGKLGITKRKL